MMETHTQAMDRLAQAQMLRSQGMTFAQIAEVMGTTRSTISGLLHRQLVKDKIAGIQRGPRRRWTQEMVDEALARRADGLTLAEVASRFGVSLGSVANAIHRHKERQARGDTGVGSGNHRNKGGTALRARMRAARATAEAKAGERKYPSTAYPAPDSLSISFADIRPNQCRWPINDAGPGEEHLFCGVRTAFGQSYCDHHRSIAYQDRGAERIAA